MITYVEAKNSAEKYFETNLNIYGIANAKEDDDFWYFWGGKQGEEIVGGLVLSVEKANGNLEIVEMPSHESIVRLRKAQVVNNI